MTLNPRLISRLMNGYVVGMGGYIITNCYFDSKKKLNDFRNGRIDEYDRRHRIRDEYEAAKYGVEANIPLYLITSFLWPFMFPLITIPNIVLKMNPSTNTLTNTSTNTSEQEK